MTDILQVIGWKFNHQEGMAVFDGVITEFPNGIPSQADQDKWTKEYEEHLASTKYQRDRKPLYGTWEEQLDMMYHGTWKNHVAKVKADIPKGNS